MRVRLGLNVVFVSLRCLTFLFLISAELGHIFGLTKPSAVFCSKKSHGTMRKLVEKLPYVEIAVYVGDEKVSGKKLVPLRDILKG